MPRVRTVRLVSVALLRAALRSRRMRWALACVGALGAWSLTGGHARAGTWRGFSNEYAPREGTIELTGSPGKTTACTVRGETGYVQGDGWVFKGKASVRETSCDGKIARDGRVSAVLTLKTTWNGRVKGTGGDWESTRGEATCRGELGGKLDTGGTWAATCKSEGKEWKTSFAWKPSGE